MNSIIEALRPHSRSFGAILLAGVLVGAVIGLAVSMLAYPKQMAVVYVQIGIVPRNPGAPTLYAREPLQKPNIDLIETVPDTVARITSRSFAEKVAERLGQPDLVDALDATARGLLVVRPVPTMEGGLIELSYSSDDAGAALVVVRAVARELAVEHRALFLTASEPYLARRAELSADLAERRRLLGQLEAAIENGTDEQLVPLLQVGRIAAADVVEDASEALETYTHRMAIIGIQNTHLVAIIGNQNTQLLEDAVVRRPILSVLAVAATLGALGGLSVALLICAALYRRPKD